MAKGASSPKTGSDNQLDRDLSTAKPALTREDELEAELGLLRVLSSIEQIRDIAQEKRELLLQSSQDRVRKKKGIYVISGLIALVSGGTASALIAPAADIIGVKLVAAGLAFVSGAIALVTTAFFDEKETAKINEGAGRYGELRNRANVPLSTRDRNLKEIDAIFERLSESQATLQKEFDIYVDTRTIAKKSDEVVERLNSKLERSRVEILARYGKILPGNTPLAETTGTGLPRETSGTGLPSGGNGLPGGGPVGGGFPSSGGFRLGPSFNTRPDWKG